MILRCVYLSYKFPKPNKTVILYMSTQHVYIITIIVVESINYPLFIQATFIGCGFTSPSTEGMNMIMRIIPNAYLEREKVYF